jgi:pimeloyl-ACP methyl ester carboxylesterase
MSEITEAATHHVIDVKGMTISYHDLGEGDPLLLLPFWGPQPGLTAWLALHKVLPTLAARYRCIAMDLPNYGRTGPVTYNEPVHDVIARHALALLDHLGIEQFNAVGTSVGATTCLDIAIAEPTRVRKLVIGSCHASTGGDPYLLAPFPSEASLAMRAFVANPDETRLRRVLSCCVHDEALLDDTLVEQIAANRAAAPDHVEALAKSYSVPHSNLSLLDNVKVQTMILHGRFDRMVPCEQGLMLLNYIPSADLAILNNCGHWPPYEVPGEWLSHVQRFLDS